MSRFEHYVFVDFENLPNVDLRPAEKYPVHVTLLIGKNQTKLGLELVKTIKILSDRLEIIEVGAAGHNALDLTLAYHLGRAIERTPDATFAIVSKDKDFDPLVAHLVAKNIRASRHVGLGTLAFLAQPEKPTAPKMASPAKSNVAPKPKPQDLEQKLITIWKNAPKSRPSTRTKLNALVKNMLGTNATEARIQSVADRLRVHGHLTIANDGKITYP